MQEGTLSQYPVLFVAEPKETEQKDKKPEEKKEAQQVQKISPAEYRRLHP